MFCGPFAGLEINGSGMIVPASASNRNQVIQPAAGHTTFKFVRCHNTPSNMLRTWINGIYSVIQKDGLNFVRLYFLNYTWYVNYLHNI